MNSILALSGNLLSTETEEQLLVGGVTSGRGSLDSHVQQNSRGAVHCYIPLTSDNI